MACRYFLNGRELVGNDLTSYLQSVPHEQKLKLAPEIAKDSFSRISWTPGEVQAARYDLSKQVDAIRVHRQDSGLFDVAVKPKGTEHYQSGASQYNVPSEKLQDVVGKELAEKILGEVSVDNPKEYTGLDLKMGGEFHKKLYDVKHPQVFNKIGKPHGVKVEQGTTAGNPGYWGEGATEPKYNPPEQHPVHYMDIPESLKQQALKKGFSLFEDSSVGAPIAALEKSGAEYRGEHMSAGPDSGSPMHDVTQNGTYPKDFYSHNGLKYYGTGDDALDAASYSKIRELNGRPDQLVKAYRAIPWEGKKPDATLNGNNERSKINPGDWVTISRGYAKQHGEGALNGKYAITMKRVPARELFTSGDSFHEWGWHPSLENKNRATGGRINDNSAALKLAYQVKKVRSHHEKFKSHG